MTDGSHVTSADIARIARVSRTTVSNWRRRHADFPAPVGGAGNRAVFDRSGIERWLAQGGRLPERTPRERVWERVRAAAADAELGDVVAEVQHLLFCLSRDDTAAAGVAEARLTARPGGRDLAREVREEADGPERLSGLSDDLEDAYRAASGVRHQLTPVRLSRIMVDLAGVRGAEVFDPACGTGTLLRTAVLAGGRALYGQEIVPATARLARARAGMASEGVPVEVADGDALTGDAFVGRVFDAVLCNPPFNQKDWGADRLAYDERWVYGVPPRSESELAWVQHCLAHTRPGGRTVVLMPPAAAARPSGRRVRRELVRTGALRAVVGLPAGAAAPLHVGLHLWVLEQPGARGVTDPRILFVAAGGGARAGDMADEDGGVESGRRPVDWDALGGVVAQAWQGFLDVENEEGELTGVSRAVPAIDVIDDAVDLTPERHLPRVAAETSPEEARERADRMRRRVRRALERTSGSVPGARWAAKETGEWSMVTLTDLARSGALTLIRAQSGRSGNAAPGIAAADGGPRVLTLADVLSGRRPSDRPDEAATGKEEDEPLEIRAGDVVVPSALGRGTPSRARVVTEEDAGACLGANLHLLRPDPAHIDPWFLAGFLDDEDARRRPGNGSSVTRVDLKRLNVPLLSSDEQARYGAAFRELHEFRAELDRARSAATDLRERLSSGLRTGLLSPPPATRIEDDTDTRCIGQT